MRTKKGHAKRKDRQKDWQTSSKICKNNDMYQERGANELFHFSKSQQFQDIACQDLAADVGSTDHCTMIIGFKPPVVSQLETKALR